MSRLPLLMLLASLCLAPVALAATPCVPTETTERRIVLAWPALTAPADYTLTAWRLQRTGDTPTILPPLAPEALTMTDTVEPGAHAWQMQAQFTRTEDGTTHLSDLAPMGNPPPCVVVLAVTPPPPTLTGVSPASTLTGVPGLHVRWEVAGPDRPVQIERRMGTDATGPWVHAASAPGGFWFDFYRLEPGATYCYRVCLPNMDTPTCSEERCMLFPAVP